MLVGKIPALEFHSGYMRWLALSSVQGGLYTDLDVLPLFGPKMPFAEYQQQNCQTADTLTITEEFKFDVFLFTQNIAKTIVKKLSGEPYLKGGDSVWLNLHAKEYRIAKSRDTLQVMNTGQNVYFQKHRRSPRQIASAEELKKLLKGSNFLNTHKIFLLNTEVTPAICDLEKALKDVLECPGLELKHDLERIQPYRAQKCHMKSISSLKDLALDVSAEVQNLYIIFVHDPMSHVMRSGIESSQLLPRLFPNLPSDAAERQIRQLKSLIRSRNVIFLPIDMDTERLVLFLEFSLGMLVRRIDKTIQINPFPAEHRQLVEEKMRGELEVYSMIVSYFNDQVAKLIEFDYE